MSSFRPMVKMDTSEPTVELKLKKGGSVSKPKKMMNGGMMGSLPAAAAPVGARGGMGPVARPTRPSLAARRAAMKAAPMGRPTMKEGGETKAEHKAEMAAIKSVDKKLSKHAEKAASKAHKGLKTGGVVMGQGGYKTGGVVMGQGGYKDGGGVKGGGVEGNVSSAKPGATNTKTGEVKLGNAGFKKGGASKKAYATGGSVNDTGRPVAYPKKPVSKPVKNNLQSGTFKKGGKVKMAGGGALDGQGVISDAERKMLLDAEKVPSDIQEQIQDIRERKGRENFEKMKTEENESLRDFIPSLGRKAMRGIKELFGSTPKGSGSVTETEKSVTVTPGKKRGGRAR